MPDEILINVEETNPAVLIDAEMVDSSIGVNINETNPSVSVGLEGDDVSVAVNVSLTENIVSVNIVSGQGEPGEPGAQGEPGPQGETGENGDQTVFAIAQSDLERSSTIVASADPELFLNLTEGVWEITGQIHLSEKIPTNASGVRGSFSISSGAVNAGSSIFFKLYVGSTPVTMSSSFSRPAVGFLTVFPTNELVVNTSRATYEVSALIKMTGSGTLNFNWAQNISSSTPLVRYASSYIKRKKI